MISNVPAAVGVPERVAVMRLKLSPAGIVSWLKIQAPGISVVKVHLKETPTLAEAEAGLVNTGAG